VNKPAVPAAIRRLSWGRAPDPKGSALIDAATNPITKTTSHHTARASGHPQVQAIKVARLTVGTEFVNVSRPTG
jgi:hypothetical protein